MGVLVVEGSVAEERREEGKENMVFVEGIWEGRKGKYGVCGRHVEGRQGIGRDGEFQHHGYTCSETERVPW